VHNNFTNQRGHKRWAVNHNVAVREQCWSPFVIIRKSSAPLSCCPCRLCLTNSNLNPNPTTKQLQAIVNIQLNTVLYPKYHADKFIRDMYTLCRRLIVTLSSVLVCVSITRRNSVKTISAATLDTQCRLRSYKMAARIGLQYCCCEPPQDKQKRGYVRRRMKTTCPLPKIATEWSQFIRFLRYT